MHLLPSHARRGSVARRLLATMATMLLPLVAVAGLGVVLFRSSVDGLEEFRTETVDETAIIEQARDLLVLADDAGEAYVEKDNPKLGDDFAVLSGQIEHSFEKLKTLNTGRERGARREGSDEMVARARGS